MPTLSHSPGALAVALVPLLALHVLAVALIAATGSDPRFTTPDAILIAVATRLGLEATLFFGLHLLAKWRGIRSRSAYAAFGAVAAVVSYVVTVYFGLWPRLASEGAVLTTGLAPASAGLIAGILYHQVAGFDWRGRDKGGAPAGGDSDALATGTGRPVAAYAGPLQVRSSFAAFALASLAPALACGLVAFPFLFSTIAGLNVGAPRVPKSSQLLLGAATPMAMTLLASFVSALPTALFIWAGHALARAFGRIDVRSYALAGAAVAFVAPAALSGGKLAAPALALAVFGAGIMAIYRLIAGLEPKPLPAPVFVRNPDDLVEADHPARQEHRIVYQR